MIANEKAGGRSAGLDIRAWALAAAAVWTALVCAGWLSEYLHVRRQALAQAKNEADISIKKDMTYRKWVTVHGGVYVPVTESSPPNPYLVNIPERDIKTPSGRRLTLINPAYMTRQVHELSSQLYGDRGHITSLKPIRPENKADAWEERALRAFETGVSEHMETLSLPYGNYLRLIRPFRTERACLRCHAAQGYKEGEIRGGISVTVPIPAYSIFPGPLTAAAAALWAAGLLLLRYFYLRLRRYSSERETDLALARRDLRLGSALLNTSGALLVALDPEGRVCLASAAVAELLGWQPGELHGKDWFEAVIPEQARAAARRELEAALKSGPGAALESALLARDGKFRQVHWKCSPLAGESGAPEGVLLRGEEAATGF